MPSDADGSRCTFMLFSDHLPGGETYGQEGKWVKGLCNKSGKFVCQLDPKRVTTNCPLGWTYRKMQKYLKIFYGLPWTSSGHLRRSRATTKDLFEHVKVTCWTNATLRN